MNELFYNIYTEPVYAVNRICTPSWCLNNTMALYNMTLVYEGIGIFEKNGEKFVARAGDLVFYEKGDYRKAYTVEENLMKCYAVDFFYTNLQRDTDRWEVKEFCLPFPKLKSIKDPYLYTKLLDLFSLMTKLSVESKKDVIIRSRSVFTQILSLLYQYEECDEYTYSDKRRAEQIINYLSNHYTQKISLKVIENEMHLSSSYLGNIFKKVTGKSIIEYLICIRLIKAKELLRDGHSVQDVATMVGFNDIFYFSKIFKKYEGITPTKYKME